MSPLGYTKLPSRLGWIHLVARGATLVAVAFDDRWDDARAALEKRIGGTFEATGGVDATIQAAMKAYFANDVRAIDEIEVDPGGTEFQQRVWSQLRSIEPGTTATYGAIAKALGDANATRAVGTANGANPIPIVIPCHRVIAADGKLHGYSSGIKRKKWLLEHEGALSPLFRASGLTLNIDPIDPS